MSKLPTWIEQVVDPLHMHAFNWVEWDGILVDSQHVDSEAVAVSIWAKSTFSSRAEIPFTTTWCEQLLGEAVLNKALEYAQLSKSAVICDLGCGDGRYVKYLLTLGFSKIVALNYEMDPLVSLQKRLSASERGRVLLICADINEHPMLNAISEFVIAWSLFTSVLNFKNTMSKCLDLIKPGCFLLNVEPVLEHVLAYSLVMNDLEEFRRILSSRTRAKMWDQKNVRYRVYSTAELHQFMQFSEICRIWESGIDALPSLLYGGLAQKVEMEKCVKESLWNELKDVHGEWYRQIAFFSQKKIVQQK